MTRKVWMIECRYRKKFCEHKYDDVWTPTGETWYTNKEDAEDAISGIVPGAVLYRVTPYVPEVKK